MVNSIIQFLLWEFHYSRFGLCHENDKRFSETPWLPGNVYYQWIYLAYRWITALYFFSYILFTSIAANSPEYLVFLTHWSLIIFTTHLIWSAISTTIRYFQVHVFCRSKFKELHGSTNIFKMHDKPVGCCGVTKDKTTWYQKVQWLLISIGNPVSLIVTILYWSILYQGQGVPKHSNIAIHAMNGVVAVIDQWVSGVPVRILHAIYPMIFAATYGTFSGVYYAAGGLVGPKNETFIYPVLNYEESPGIAIGIVIGVVFAAVPLVHILFWIMYLLKEGLLYLIKNTCCGSKNNENIV